MRPTEPRPPLKRKNTSPLRVIVNQWGCLLGLVMLGLGGAIGLLGAIFIGPQLLGFDVTATALVEREIVLAATQVELDVQAEDARSRATTFALDVQSTQAILNNDADLLAQTATQSANNVIATTTANANFNVQRQTQIANDFASTQSALDQRATQVAIDFRETQTAIQQESGQVPDANVEVVSGRYTFDFAQVDLNTNNAWRVSDDAWQMTDTGIRVSAETAYLVEPQARILPNNDFTDTYSFTASITPAIGVDADYWLIIGLEDDSGVAAHFYADTLNVTQVGLYRFDSEQLDTGLVTDNLTVIRRNAADVSLNGQSQLTIAINDELVTLQIDDETVLTAQGISIAQGALGIQLPEGAILRTITVSD